MLWAVIVVAVVGVAAVMVFRSRSPKYILIGQQLADARRADETRLAKGPVGPSPMPSGAYDAERGESSLISVSVVPFDEELQALVRQFRGWDAEKREAVRRTISMDEQYTLIQFAKRSSVLALSEQSGERCTDGINALALIDETRIDSRDASWAAGLLSYAVSATKIDRRTAFERAVVLATPGMAQILRAASKSDRLSDWGYAVVTTERGIGLIQSGFASYQPTLELDKLGLRVAESLGQGRYVAAVEIAVEIPPVWFTKDRQENVAKALAHARGAVSVHGTLRSRVSGPCQDADAHAVDRGDAGREASCETCERSCERLCQGRSDVSRRVKRAPFCPAGCRFMGQGGGAIRIIRDIGDARRGNSCRAGAHRRYSRLSGVSWLPGRANRPAESAGA
jgi:hypothetical protein